VLPYAAAFFLPFSFLYGDRAGAHAYRCTFTDAEAARSAPMTQPHRLGSCGIMREVCFRERNYYLTFRLIPPLSLTWAEHFEMEKCFYREDRGIIGKLGTPIRLHQLANNSPNHFHQALLNLNRPLRRIALGGKIV
jgi:hypothetical protein